MEASNHGNMPSTHREQGFSMDMQQHEQDQARKQDQQNGKAQDPRNSGEWHNNQENVGPNRQLQSDQELNVRENDARGQQKGVLRHKRSRQDAQVDPNLPSVLQRHVTSQHHSRSRHSSTASAAKRKPAPTPFRSLRRGRFSKKAHAATSSSRTATSITSTKRKSPGFPSSSTSSKTSSRAQSHRSSQSRTSTRARMQARPWARAHSAASAHGSSAHTPATYIVCSIAENLAGETCVASIDAGTPTTLQVTKQSNNGQTYAETLAYLEILKPQEVLLNEGRKTSTLVQKIVEFFDGCVPTSTALSAGCARRKAATAKRRGRLGARQSSHRSCGSSVDSRTSEKLQGAAPEDGGTRVKFVPRACFDQTKGAELLHRIARKETYDSTVVEEYILLSAANALLQYTQQYLDAMFARECLSLVINSGGQNRMAIDRSTLLQLELLVNAKTGKTKNSLIDSIDRTKTAVGSRLLRSNLMAPPCRPCTIHSRLDLVDAFLSNEELFYSVMDHLKKFPDVDKVLASIALVPRMSTYDAAEASKRGTGQPPRVMERLASKGIAALVCIKTALSALPSFAATLQDFLERIDNDDHSSKQGQQSPDVSQDGHPDTSSDTQLNDASSLARRSKGTSSFQSSLLIGLGAGSMPSTAPMKHLLLRAILCTLQQPALGEVLEAVTGIFTDSTNFTRNAHEMRHQTCFALRPDDNGMIDVLRKHFLANVDSIYKKADSYAEIHGFHVSVRYSTKRGYYLVVPNEVAATLPTEFIMPSKIGRSITCTTEEVQSLNARALDNVKDILAITYEQIEQVLDVARSKYDAIAALSDAVALLDMCHSVADVVTLSTEPWVRPEIIDPDTMTHASSRVVDGNSDNLETARIYIQGGRHGVMMAGSAAAAGGMSGIVPNDTFLPFNKRHTIISGINGSGKSTYLKQVGIIAILAHCGSYVPAQKARLPTWTRLCARIGNGDDQENNISSFLMEMKEVGFICRNANEQSLVLIDELGRATSNEDGIAIAWSVLEYLLKTKATTFFVTHYQDICQMGEVYSDRVQNQHVEAKIEGDGGIGNVFYSHKVRKGMCKVTSDYGVHVAACCGWPDDLLKIAQQAEAQLHTTLPSRGLCEDQSSIETSIQLKQAIRSIVNLVQTEETLESLKTKLQHLRTSLSVSDEKLGGVLSSMSRSESTSKHVTEAARTDSNQNDELE